MEYSILYVVLVIRYCNSYVKFNFYNLVGADTGVVVLQLIAVPFFLIRLQRRIRLHFHLVLMLPLETALQGLVMLIMKRTHSAVPREKVFNKLRIKNQRLRERNLIQTK